jgi:hypothetical protein
MSGNYPDGVNQQVFDEAHEEMDDLLDENVDDEEFDNFLEFDCRMGPDGQCGAAGSEECDFECPIMAEIQMAAAKKRAGRKRGKR